jgi:phosphoglycerate dehydrogenase-like enzyme
MPKVLIAPMTLQGVNGAYANLLRNAGFELVYPGTGHQLSEEELLAALSGITASLAGSEPYTRRVLGAHPGLKAIARLGVGYDAVDLAAATELGIPVTITPGANHDSVAEHTFALMLALVKDLVHQNNTLKSGGWPRKTNVPLRGKTLGIAGLGRIGKAVALRGKCFRMALLAYDPFPDQVFAREHGVRFVPLEQLLAEADFLSLHLPLTAGTRYLINRTTLLQMKPGAYLINAARGGLVCEADLYEALQNKRLAGAALDVFEQEPPGVHPLFALDNVVVTPHAAGTDWQSRDDMALSAAEAIVSLSRGGWPEEKVVNAAVRGRTR